MSIGLILGLLKVSLDIFHDERKDRFLKQWTELNEEWENEMSEPDDTRSDLKLDQLLFKCTNLAELVISEHSK